MTLTYELEPKLDVKYFDIFFFKLAKPRKKEVELIWCCGDSIFVRSCPADSVRPQAGEFQLLPLRQFA